MGRLDGRVALVTGGTSGIGRATALAFSREGAKVLISGRAAERGQEAADYIKANGGHARFLQADMGKPEEIHSLMAKAVEIYGRLDCAFNNAASEPAAFMPMAEISEEDFDREVAVNLKGVWLCMKHEIQQMLRQESKGGAIVNTSSVNGLGGAPQAAIYSAAKSGVLALTKSAAWEYAKHGIRVNALVPGAFRTPMLERGLKRLSGDDPKTREGIEDQYFRLIPLGRFGVPMEAAEAVVWLCSDAASYVTGHSMIVDGGLTSSVR